MTEPLETIVRKVKSSSGNGTYEVKILGLRAWCSCQGFNYRGYCRHIQQVRMELGIKGAIIPSENL